MIFAHNDIEIEAISRSFTGSNNSFTVKRMLTDTSFLSTVALILKALLLAWLELAQFVDFRRLVSTW